MRSLLSHPRRVWRVAFVLIRLLVAPALHLPGADKRSGPVRLRLAFESLGGAWIKLGQMLALRYDLLPVPYCDELFKLLNQVAPFSYEEVRASSGRSSAPSQSRSSARSSTSRSRRRPSARSIGPCSTTAIAWRSRSSVRGSGRRSTRTSSSCTRPRG